VSVDVSSVKSYTPNSAFVAAETNGHQIMFQKTYPQKRTNFIETNREFRNIRRIFGPKSDEVTGGWRKLHNEELYNLYSSPSITRMIKSRRMRWVRHVTRTGAKRNAYRI
jgi:hypothetical protein